MGVGIEMGSTRQTFTCAFSVAKLAVQRVVIFKIAI